MAAICTKASERNFLRNNFLIIEIPYTEEFRNNFNSKNPSQVFQWIASGPGPCIHQLLWLLLLSLHSWPLRIDSICQGSELSLSIWCRIFNAAFVLGIGSAVINLEINSNKERAATLSIQEVCRQQWPSIETSCQASKLHQFKLYRPTELLKKLIYTQIRDFSNMTPDQFPKFTAIQKSFQVQILCQLVESEIGVTFPDCYCKASSVTFFSRVLQRLHLYKLCVISRLRLPTVLVLLLSAGPIWWQVTARDRSWPPIVFCCCSIDDNDELSLWLKTHEGHIQLWDWASTNPRLHL